MSAQTAMESRLTMRCLAVPESSPERDGAEPSFSIEHNTHQNKGDAQRLDDKEISGQGGPIQSELIDNAADKGAENDALIESQLSTANEVTTPATCGVLVTAGTSILSAGTRSQVRQQRQRFLNDLENLIEQDTAAWIDNRRIVREMLAEEIAKAEASGNQ